MTSRLSDEARAKALAALTREASECQVPELDWERIEARVLDNGAHAAVARGTNERRTSRPRWTPSAPTRASTPWPVAVAAAAAAALVYGGPSNAIRPPVPANEASAVVIEPRAAAADLSSLEVGKVAETSGRAALYDHPGVVSFSLAPNSRVEVVANDIDEHRNGGITVALSRGSIHADVTPRTDGEVFAVEVERTRIAVHGTSFTVSRDGDRVMVDVAHGAVAVGPVGHRGSTHGWLVVGPDRAAFSLDGGREATWLPAPAQVASAASLPAVEAVPVAAVDAPASRSKRFPSVATPPGAEVVARSAKVEVRAASGSAPSAGWGEGATSARRDPSEHEASEISAILRQLEACYEKQVSAFGVRFSVESSLELTILPSGVIREGVFTPPLSPTLMSCADKAVGAAHFAGGDAPRQIRIPVQLSRAPL